jgi:hypothetical protein
LGERFVGSTSLIILALGLAMLCGALIYFFFVDSRPSRREERATSRQAWDPDITAGRRNR